MTTMQKRADTDAYRERFEEFERQRAAARPAWLVPLRKAAAARFAELGFPTTRDEDWRFTNVSPIADSDFSLPRFKGSELTAKQIEPYTFEGAGTTLVFVNGRFTPELSACPELPTGVQVGGLAAAFRTDVPVVKAHLGHYASYEKNAFTALNTAFVEDGAFVHVGSGRVVEQAIHLLFVSVNNDGPHQAHPRNLIVAEPNSQATIVESHGSIGDARYFTNSVTEVIAGDNAVLDCYKLGRDSDAAFHVDTTQIQLARSSTVTMNTITLGGALVRNNANVVLAGEGGDCTLNGLYMIGGHQHVDNHLRVEHAAPHCNSWEYYKGILNGASRGVFTGRIFVEKGAQKTDAKQTNMSLLLSDQAQVESKPQLEIFADDVKCTHGATIGQIDRDALFYLRSRGMSDKLARSLLVQAFAREITDQIALEPMRARLEEMLLVRLPQGELLRDNS